jgi:hypothetical protein
MHANGIRPAANLTVLYVQLMFTCGKIYEDFIDLEAPGASKCFAHGGTLAITCGRVRVNYPHISPMSSVAVGALILQTFFIFFRVQLDGRVKEVGHMLLTEA